MTLKTASRERILVPIKQVLEAEEFPAENYKRNDKALKECHEAGYDALFMPQIIDARIVAPFDARIWQMWYSSPSIMATGKTKQGNPVVVYAHIPNYFSNPDNITKAINDGLINYAGILPQKSSEDFWTWKAQLIKKEINWSGLWTMKN